MALDYDLEIDQYGTQNKLAEIQSFIQSEFNLTPHEETIIMTAPGVSISVFVEDEDDIETDDEGNLQRRACLNVSFRIDKFKLQQQGYKLMLDVVQKLFELVKVDLYLMNDNFDTLLQRVSGKTTVLEPEHDMFRDRTLEWLK